MVVDVGLFWLGSGLTTPDLSLAARGTIRRLRPGETGGAQRFAVPQCRYFHRASDVRNGFAEVPTGLGLGVEVDEAKVAVLMT